MLYFLVIATLRPKTLLDLEAVLLDLKMILLHLVLILLEPILHVWLYVIWYLIVVFLTSSKERTLHYTVNPEP